MKLLLLASIAANAVALLICAFVIRGRGGLAYIRSHFGRSAGAATFPGYLNRELLFQCLRADQPIVFLGDSITQNAEWHELISCGAPVLNRGIGGDTSLGVLRRVDTIRRLNPRAVFLQIGTNDAYTLGLKPHETVANIRAIVRALQPTQVFVQTLLPARSPKKNQFVRAANEKILRGIPGAEIIDLHDAFLRGDHLDPQYSVDGLHLNGEGYLLWKRLLESQVAMISGKQTRSRMSLAAH